MFKIKDHYTKLNTRIQSKISLIIFNTDRLYTSKLNEKTVCKYTQTMLSTVNINKSWRKEQGNNKYGLKR